MKSSSKQGSSWPRVFTSPCSKVEGNIGYVYFHGVELEHIIIHIKSTVIYLSYMIQMDPVIKKTGIVDTLSRKSESQPIGIYHSQVNKH